MARAPASIGEFVLPVQIEPLDEGGFLAICPAIQGCHAEGRTIPQALGNLEDVARVLLQLRMEDGLGIPKALQAAKKRRRLKGEILVSV